MSRIEIRNTGYSFEPVSSKQPDDVNIYDKEGTLLAIKHIAEYVTPEYRRDKPAFVFPNILHPSGKYLGRVGDAVELVKLGVIDNVRFHPYTCIGLTYINREYGDKCRTKFLDLVSSYVLVYALGILMPSGGFVLLKEKSPQTYVPSRTEFKSFSSEEEANVARNEIQTKFADIVSDYERWEQYTANMQVEEKDAVPSLWKSFFHPDGSSEVLGLMLEKYVSRFELDYYLNGNCLQVIQVLKNPSGKEWYR